VRALSLFTGYAGIDLALSEYVSEVVAYVEIEEYCQKIIAYRMADGSIKRAPILADVKNVEGKAGDCDIIYGGFPCQDISVAGNGKGLVGERSGLFYEIIRLTKEIRPTFVFLENVPAIRTRGLEQVIKEFTEIGYDCRWTCLSAASVGAPHKRERWFLLAHTNCHGNQCQIGKGDGIQKAEGTWGRGLREIKNCVICLKTFAPKHSKNPKTCSSDCLKNLGRLNALKRWKKDLEPTELKLLETE